MLIMYIIQIVELILPYLWSLSPRLMTLYLPTTLLSFWVFVTKCPRFTFALGGCSCWAACCCAACWAC